MNISIIGAGYVGLVTGVALADIGHNVICIGRDKEKIQNINNGKAPFYETGLDSLLKKHAESKKLQASAELDQSVRNTDITIIAVGTPTVDNKIDLSALEAVSRDIGKILKNKNSFHTVVVKSTVVPTTTEKIVKPLLEQHSEKQVGEFGLCMNPEFLREGSALEEALNPDRIVIGQHDKQSGNHFKKVYEKYSCPKLITNLRTAELIKYASNALFATMISYSNEIARIAEELENIDVQEVWKGVHLDNRLSPSINGEKVKPGFLSYILSGCGYGGSCFPKDTQALASFAKEIGIQAAVLDAVICVNKTQPERVVKLIMQAIGSLEGKKIAILGLTFKPDTDDIRESPSLTLINLLKIKNVSVRVHDPVAYTSHKETIDSSDLDFKSTIEETLQDADAAVIMTAWDDYKNLKPEIFKKHLKQPIVVDGRRIYDKNEFMDNGIKYMGVGFVENT